MLLKKQVLVHLLLNILLKNYFLVILEIIDCGQKKYFVVLILYHLLKMPLLSILHMVIALHIAYD